MINTKTVTIGIPTLNRQKYLIQTISSILENKIEEIKDIIIVDQTIDIDIIEENKIYFSNINFNIKYILLSEPSVCKARNTIILESTSDVIYFVDDDVLFSKNIFKEHLLLYNDKNIVSTLGKIYNRNSNIDISNLDIDSPMLGTHENFPDDNEINFNFQGSGVSCNQTYLRNVLIEIKGFDQNFAGGYFEDADIVNRIRKKGYKIGFNPKAYVLHLKAPMGGLRFDKIQPISTEIKFYSFLFFYIRYFKFNKYTIKDFYKVLRAGPLKKENIKNIKNGILLWLRLPKLIIKAIKNKNLVNSIIDI
jgi:GT2 family glycosyltransferase